MTTGPISTGGARVFTAGNLASKAITGGVFNAASLVVSTVSGGTLSDTIKARGAPLLTFSGSGNARHITLDVRALALTAGQINTLRNALTTAGIGGNRVIQVTLVS